MTQASIIHRNPGVGCCPTALHNPFFLLVFLPSSEVQEIELMKVQQLCMVVIRVIVFTFSRIV